MSTELEDTVGGPSSAGHERARHELRLSVEQRGLKLIDLGEFTMQGR